MDYRTSNEANTTSTYGALQPETFHQGVNFDLRDPKQGYLGNRGMLDSYSRPFSRNDAAYYEGRGKSGYNQSAVIDNKGTNSHNTVRMCRFGQSCGGIGRDCKFGHDVIQKLCRCGLECNRKSMCLFLHDTAERDGSVNHQGNNSKNQNSRY